MTPIASMKWIAILVALWGSNQVVSHAQDTGSEPAQLAPPFAWTTGAPVVHSRDVGGISTYSIKDPTIVRDAGRWHLFCTIRGRQRSHAVVYLNFENWKQADQVEHRLVTMHDGYFCAPQVFYFTPHQRWYMICQAAHDDWEPNYQPAFSTTTTLRDPDSWTPLKPLYGYKPENLKGWIDFWVICDEAHAHLFFTSNDGKVWRAETTREKFPEGFSQPDLVLEADIFEASHTYRIQGTHQYLTLVEAQHGHGWRYYKAYRADDLAGPWRELAATRDEAFASMRNVSISGSNWTDSISHAELLRSGRDEFLEVNPQHLRLLYRVHDALCAFKAM